MKRLFLSFSVNGDPEGRAFARRLFERLKEQAIDCWIYESPRGEIQAGTSIADACRLKIEEADAFVVLITDQALRSDYVDMEVSHALWVSGRRPLPIVPLIATEQSTNRWPAALQEVTGLKGFRLPPPLGESLEMAVVHLCVLLGLEYAPPRPTTPRLPLGQRLTDELKTSQSGSGYDMGEFVSLLRKCDLVAEAMARDDYGRAKRVLESILTDLEISYALATPYYPLIVYGAILMGEASAGRGSFQEAERYFGALIAEEADRLDANAFVGRANARVALGRYAEALTDYYAAEQYMEGPDAALFYNIVRARVLGGLTMDDAEVERRQAALVEGLVTRVPGDLARLTSSMALIHAYGGRTAAAIEMWRQIGDLEAVFPELVVDVCHHLHAHAIRRESDTELREVTALLSDYIARRGDLSEATLLPLRHLHARVSFDRGERTPARRQLDDLMRRFPATPVIHLDAARFALDDRDIREARRLCLEVASFRDASQCVPPLSAEEFNLALGHAFWLLGRENDAKEAFRRSGYGPSQWYGTTMRRDFGRVR
jgi:tetratricopeptide (TPR) repeat protein